MPEGTTEVVGPAEAEEQADAELVEEYGVLVAAEYGYMV
jgi:hypothetical protein